MAAVWKWCDLDKHPHDNIVSRHELFPLRNISFISNKYFFYLENFFLKICKKKTQWDCRIKLFRALKEFYVWFTRYSGFPFGKIDNFLCRIYVLEKKKEKDRIQFNKLYIKKVNKIVPKTIYYKHNLGWVILISIPIFKTSNLSTIFGTLSSV